MIGASVFIPINFKLIFVLLIGTSHHFLQNILIRVIYRLLNITLILRQILQMYNTVLSLMFRLPLLINNILLIVTILVVNGLWFHFIYFLIMLRLRYIVDNSEQIWQPIQKIKYFLKHYKYKYGNLIIYCNYMLSNKLYSIRYLLYSTKEQSKYLFSKKKNTQSKTKSYNLNIDESKIPDHLKTMYKVKKQALKMEVASEAELANSHICQQIIRQRQQIEKKGQQKMEFDILEKTNIGLTILNAGTVLALSMTNMNWLGIYSAMFLSPSFLITGAIAIGINIGYLVIRQGLNMHMPIKDIQNIKITDSPVSYAIQTCFIAYQMWWFSISRFMYIDQIPIIRSLQPQSLTMVLGLTGLSIVGHSYYQWKDFPQTKTTSVHLKCFAITSLLLVYVLQNNLQNTQFQQGMKHYENLWKIQRHKIKAGEKINE